MRRCNYQGTEGAGDLPCGEREEALNGSARAKEAAAPSCEIRKQNQQIENATAKREQCESNARALSHNPQDEIGKCPADIADIADIADKASDQRAWERFSAAWPFDPVPYRRAAAQAEFERLTEAEREDAIRCAVILAKSRRSSGRIAAPDVRRWIKEKRWKSSARRSGACLNVRKG
jgi:hypothetical protein